MLLSLLLLPLLLTALTSLLALLSAALLGLLISMLRLLLSLNKFPLIAALIPLLMKGPLAVESELPPEAVDFEDAVSEDDVEVSEYSLALALLSALRALAA
jgi:hypothetical protein